MKILKRILGVLVGIIVLALVVALFIKKEYAVVREISINKPKAEVFDYIKYVKNQNEYSVWSMRDPNMKKEYRGVDGTVGFVSAWDSQNDKVGKGEQEIKKIADGDRIDFELRFIKPFEATDAAYMTTESKSGNETKVKWGFNGKMRYPLNLLLLFIDMDKMLGNDLQTGLVNLKKNLEAKEPGYNSK